MRFGERSLSPKSFEPSRVQRLAILQVPIASGASKLFVAIHHAHDSLWCLKATADLLLYKNNPARQRASVVIPAGEIAQFSQRTVIQADNPFRVPYAALTANSVIGRIPDSYRSALAEACKHASTLDASQRARFLSELTR